MCRHKNSTHVSAGYVGPSKIDVAQKNWFEVVNNSLETNLAASMQIHNELQARKCSALCKGASLLHSLFYYALLCYYNINAVDKIKHLNKTPVKLTQYNYHKPSRSDHKG